MEYLDKVYVRVKDGLIMFPTQGKDSKLFNYHNSEEPPITIDELGMLEFIPLAPFINRGIIIEEDDIDILNNILGGYTETFSDDEEDQEDHKEELDLCEVLQDRIDFIKSE